MVRTPTGQPCIPTGRFFRLGERVDEVVVRFGEPTALVALLADCEVAGLPCLGDARPDGVASLGVRGDEGLDTDLPTGRMAEELG